MYGGRVGTSVPTRHARIRVGTSAHPTLMRLDLGCGRTARPALAADATFLARLYASTRTDVLHLPVPQSQSVRDGIIAHQQQLQADDYRARYPGADYLIVEQGGEPVGRVVIERGPDAIRVVDLAIDPSARRRGHARAVLAALQLQAAAQGCVLKLRVRQDNRSARALYAALGFEEEQSGDGFAQLRWASAQKE
jgi:ribosomal protein S18 acetylase RimI-like enzyme